MYGTNDRLSFDTSCFDRRFFQRRFADQADSILSGHVPSARTGQPVEPLMQRPTAMPSTSSTPSMPATPPLSTDAIAAARMGPGIHRLSGMEVEVDDQGVARRPGSPYLAGSTIRMPKVRENLSQNLGRSQADIDRLTSTNPRSALG